MLLINKTTSDKRDEQNVQMIAKFLHLSSSRPPSHPSHCPILPNWSGALQAEQVFDLQHDGCQPLLSLSVFMSAFLFFPPSLYNRTTSTADVSLITVQPSSDTPSTFLLFLSPSLRLASGQPCSISSRRLRLLHAVTEWSKHELSHTSSPAHLAAAKEMMRPVDKQAPSVRGGWQAGGILGNKQRGFGWTENKRNLPGLKIALGWKIAV